MTNYYNRKDKIDQNIINAIKHLPKQMTNSLGSRITFRKSLTQETREEHIADVTHGLQVKDIMQVPHILLYPVVKKDDPNHERRINYYGKKYKNNVFYRYIKIVTTRHNKTNSEEIITIYLDKHIK